MSDFHNAPRDIFTITELMFRIRVIQAYEEDKYSEVPKWDNLIDSWTDSAVLLHFDKINRPARHNWFPTSQLRKTEDNFSIYASNWILDKKGF